MPPFPGEDRVITLYADIHYYFSQPTIRPAMHRFDKGSYFYIYYNSTRQTTRLEVANNAGTPEQDAFNGYLDKCRITNSYKFPTLVTILVDSTESAQSPGSPRPGRDANEWRLPSSDLRDQGKHLYKLHTIDFYFWAQEDSKQVTDLLKRYLHPAQLDVVELDPPDKHDDEAHPVVQNLEHVAISDPAYRNGQTRNSQNQPQALTSNNLPPPPPPPPLSQENTHTSSPVSDMSHDSKQFGSMSRPTQQTQAFTPMAYNPAAPPAPEPIAHREDTPPPEDGHTGTGLSAAAKQELPYSPGPYTAVPGPVPTLYGHPGSPPPSAYTAAPPQSAPAYQQSYHPSITAPTSSGPSYGGASMSTTTSNTSAAPPSYMANQQQQQQQGQTPSRHASTAEHKYVPHDPATGNDPVETPSAQFYPTHHASLTHTQPQYADYLSARTPQQPPQPHPQHQNQSPQPPSGVLPQPLGGYASYTYDPSQSAAQYQQQQQRPGDVHQQLYRPTEHEHAHAHGHRPSKSSGKDSSSKLDQGVDRVEKKANKLWKKIQNF